MVNYRSTRRAKSTADFINKFKIVEEELDESLFFMKLIVEFNKDKREKVAEIYKEGEQLLKMIVATLKTLRKNNIMHQTSDIVHHTSYVVHCFSDIVHKK